MVATSDQPKYCTMATIATAWKASEGGVLKKYGYAVMSERSGEVAE